MILTHRIVTAGVRRLREAIQDESGVKLLYTTNPGDFRKARHERVAFRYGCSAPLPASVQHKETVFNSPADLSFHVNKKTFTDRVLELGFLAPKFFKLGERVPDPADYPIILRETLTSFGGRGMHLCLTGEELVNHPTRHASWWWCSYIENTTEYRFHVMNPKGGLLEGGPRILRVMKKVPRTPEIEARTQHIRHVDEYHYSKRLDPYRQMPRFCKTVLSLVQELPGWLYSLDVGMTPDKELVFFESNSASGIDNGCARDYAQPIAQDLGL